MQNMSSMESTTSESPEKTDLSSVQQLVFSVGRLKFSFRALAAMHLQTSLLCQKESESSDRLSPMESNRIFENIIDEILLNKSELSRGNVGACKKDEIQNSLSVEDLELVQSKLQEEFEQKRLNFITSMSMKCKK